MQMHFGDFDILIRWFTKMYIQEVIFANLLLKYENIIFENWILEFVTKIPQLWYIKLINYWFFRQCNDHLHRLGEMKCTFKWMNEKLYNVGLLASWKWAATRFCFLFFYFCLCWGETSVMFRTVQSILFSSSVLFVQNKISSENKCKTFASVMTVGFLLDLLETSSKFCKQWVPPGWAMLLRYETMTAVLGFLASCASFIQ